MSKPLSEMTLSELWQLFPIILEQPNPIWHEQYAQEEKRIRSFLSDGVGILTDHIGSTAINGIWAKPIVDILMRIPTSLSQETVKDILTDNGYRCMSEEAERKSFNRGYTEEGFADEVFHLHLRYYGDDDELYFRDYMNDDPDAAKRYEALKLSLWKKYEHDRDAYTAAKSGFIKEMTNKARRKYKGKYN